MIVTDGAPLAIIEDLNSPLKRAGPSLKSDRVRVGRNVRTEDAGILGVATATDAPPGSFGASK